MRDAFRAHLAHVSLFGGVGSKPLMEMAQWGVAQSCVVLTSAYVCKPKQKKAKEFSERCDLHQFPPLSTKIRKDSRVPGAQMAPFLFLQRARFLMGQRASFLW